MNGVTNAPLSQDKYQWNWIRSEDATYKLLDEKTPLSFTGDLYRSLEINRVGYVGNNKPSPNNPWGLSGLFVVYEKPLLN